MCLCVCVKLTEEKKLFVCVFVVVCMFNKICHTDTTTVYISLPVSCMVVVVVVGMVGFNDDDDDDG